MPMMWVVKFASIFESEWEVLKITNMLRDDVRKMLKDMASLDEKRMGWQLPFIYGKTGSGNHVTCVQ